MTSQQSQTHLRSVGEAVVSLLKAGCPQRVFGNDIQTGSGEASWRHGSDSRMPPCLAAESHPANESVASHLGPIPTRFQHETDIVENSGKVRE